MAPGDPGTFRDDLGTPWKNACNAGGPFLSEKVRPGTPPWAPKGAPRRPKERPRRPQGAISGGFLEKSGPESGFGDKLPARIRFAQNFLIFSLISARFLHDFLTDFLRNFLDNLCSDSDLFFDQNCPKAPSEINVFLR